MANGNCHQTTNAEHGDVHPGRDKYLEREPTYTLYILNLAMIPCMAMSVLKIGRAQHTRHHALAHPLPGNELLEALHLSHKGLDFASGICSDSCTASLIVLGQLSWLGLFNI